MMTPEDKAKELIDRFLIYEKMSKYTLCKQNARDSALIVARECSYQLQVVQAKMNEINGVIGIENYFTELHIYWAKVVQEIKDVRINP